MKKLLFFILLLPSIVSGQWLNVGNTLQRSTDAYNYRTALGSPGFVYWRTKQQIDSLLALKQNTISLGSTAQYFRGDLTLATFPTNLNSFTNGPGYITANQAVTVTATGDATGTSSASGTAPSLPLTLAIVNSNTGAWGTASSVSHITVNAKGLVTAASNTAIQVAESQVTNLTTDLAAKLNTQTFLNYTRNAARFGLTTSDTIAHYDNSGGDNTFRVGGWVNCRSVTGDTIKMKVVFTDNHSSVQTIYLYSQGAIVPYAIAPMYMAFPTIDFRVLNGTTVTTSTVVTGSGSISYEAGTTITKIQGN